MDAVSACPFRVGSIVWQSGRGDHTLTVVAKATYTLLPAESPLAAEQDEITRSDGYWNYDASSDLVPFKRRADVLLVGHAFAPNGKPVRSLVARLVVGLVDKAIEVFGDRSVGPDGALREPAPFVEMPLRWERAAGGPETSNPVGVRRDGRALPNLQPPGIHVTSARDVIPPIGFGPIAPTWPARAGRLHRALAGWDHRRWHDRPLPAELDPAFFSAAPRDQQVDAIRPNERIVLENLHREHARLTTSLAAAAPRVIVERPGRAQELLGMRCDTLTIDTDRGVCTLTWRAQVPLDGPDAPGRAVVTLGRGATTIGLPTIEGALAPAADLPFVKGPALPPPPSLPASLDLWMGETSDALPEGFEAPADLLPFVPALRDDELEIEDDEEEEGELSSAVTLRPPPPAPPPLLGPLATPEMIAIAEAEEAIPTPPPEAPAAIEPDPATIVEAELPLGRYPIERCAAVSASIARRRDEAPAILDAHELTPALWEALDHHWREAIRAETGRGRTALLAKHDAAYVEQLEKERGPIDAATYARLVVAVERNAADPELAALDLPRGALLRVQRVWLRRIADDADLAKSVRRAVEAAREA
jgi:hypothetical protein